MRAAFRRQLEQSIAAPLDTQGIAVTVVASSHSRLSLAVRGEAGRKLVTFRDRDALVSCALEMLPEDDTVGLWFIFLDPSFNAMRAVSQRESATRTAREKVSWLYWRFSGFREQVPVHSAEQEEAYVSLVVPEVIPFVLRHLGDNMGGLAQR